MALQIDINKVVENRLKFEPIVELNNLCRGYITSVEVLEVEMGETNKKGETSKSEYAGKTVNKLNFNFQNHKLKATEFDRFYTKELFAIQTVLAEGGKKSIKGIEIEVTNMVDFVHHTANRYVDSSSPMFITKYKPYADAFNALVQNIDSDDVDTRIKVTTDYYKAIAEWFNGVEFGKGKDVVVYPKVYVDANGQFIPMVMKLVIDERTNRFGFPEFIGEGIMEKYPKGEFKTFLKFRPNETVVPAVRSRKAAPVTNGLPGSDAPTTGMSYEDMMKNLQQGQ